MGIDPEAQHELDWNKTKSVCENLLKTVVNETERAFYENRIASCNNLLGIEEYK
jgi:hypothetical protein